MITVSMLLIFFSAFLHAGWNVLLHGEKDPLASSTKALTIGTLILTPIVSIYWVTNGMQPLNNMAIFFGILTGLAELLYFIFLSYCYQKGELSVVYPIARGSAPVLVFFFGIFVLHETVTQMQFIGVLLLLFGIWLVRRSKLSGKGVIPAIITGVFIATYTIFDKVGLSYADPVIFGELKYFFSSLFLLLFLPVRKCFPMLGMEEKVKTNWKKVTFIGICLIGTYQIVLFAMSLSPVAIVAPLRESASVLIAAWGIWKLKERERLRYKLFGVASIFLGIIFLAIS